MAIFGQFWSVSTFYINLGPKTSKFKICSSTQMGRDTNETRRDEIETRRIQFETNRDFGYPIDTNRDKSRLLIAPKFLIRDKVETWFSGTRRDETAFLVSSRPRNRDEKFLDPSLIKILWEQPRNLRQLSIIRIQIRIVGIYLLNSFMKVSSLKERPNHHNYRSSRAIKIFWI